MSSTDMGEQGSPSERTCPYCLDNIAQGETAVACQACGSVMHSECWDENGGCCVPDCPRSVKRTEINVTEQVTLDVDGQREKIVTKPYRTAPSGYNPCIVCGRQLPEGELSCQECRRSFEESQRTDNPVALMLGALFVLGLVGLILLITIGGQWIK